MHVMEAALLVEMTARGIGLSRARAANAEILGRIFSANRRELLESLIAFGDDDESFRFAKIDDRLLEVLAKFERAGHRTKGLSIIDVRGIQDQLERILSERLKERTAPVTGWISAQSAKKLQRSIERLRRHQKEKTGERWD
jgi:hypothetical protein